MDEALSRLGLDADPFDDVVIDDLFFTGAGRGALIDELIHQVRYGTDVCLVSGDAGIGKTRLWHHLPQLAPADTVCVSMQAQMFLSAEQFTAQCLGGDEDAVQDADFLAHLQQLAEEKRQHWLLIDDAHELHESLYKKLSQWCEQFQSVLRIVLFADTTLKYRLQSPALGFSLSCWDLQPFSAADVTDYLMYRLQYCGWQSQELPFSGDELEQICRHSEGVPLHIHDLAVAILQQNDEVAPPQWQRLLRWPYLHVGLLLLAAACLAVVWIGGDGGMVNNDTADARQSAEITRPLSLPAADNVATTTTAGSEVAPAAATTSGGPAVIEFRSTMQQPAAQQAASGSSSPGSSSPRSSSTMATSPVAANAPPPIPVDAAPKTTGGTVAQPHAVESAPLVAARSVPVETAAAPLSAVDKSSAVNKSAAVKPVAPVQKPAPVLVKPATAPNLQQNATPPKTAQQKPVSAPATVKAAVSESAPATGGLAKMPPQHYVLQLIATTDPARMASFRSSLPKDLQLASYQRITNGQRWHVLVYGGFPSIAQARAAINRLPAMAREQKPWAKPVSQIHKEMATARQ